MAASPRPGLVSERLFVGNLSPSVDEFTLVRLFQRYGKIKQLNFLFHMTGPSKGKPRGYAFVEMEKKEEALKAMVELHDKVVRGRKLVVTLAREAGGEGADGKTVKRTLSSQAHRPTTLSLLRARHEPKGTNNQIAALEAKIRSLERASTSDDANLIASVEEEDDVDSFLASVDPQPETGPSTSRSIAALPAGLGLPSRPSESTIAMGERLASLEERSQLLRPMMTTLGDLEANAAQHSLRKGKAKAVEDAPPPLSEELGDSTSVEAAVPSVPEVDMPTSTPAIKVKNKAKAPKQITSASLIKAAWSKKKPR